MVFEMFGRKIICSVLLLSSMVARGAAEAAPCRTGGPYNTWLADFEREAITQGVSQRTIATAAPFLTYDQRIVNIDHGQRVFTQTFLEFSDRMAASYRIQMGAAKIKSYAQVFQRIDQQYGAGPGHRRVLGARKRFRRQYGRLSFAELDRVARL